MTIVSAILVIFYFIGFAYLLGLVLKGDFKAVLLYAVLFFPIYTLFLATVYFGTESELLIQILQYTKEILIFGALAIWVFGQRNVFSREWQISSLDRLFLAFIGLAFLFLFLPISEATKVNQIVYFKNIMLIGVFYFFGRQVTMSGSDWNRVFKVIFSITIIAAVVIITEKLMATHIHGLLGYVKYNQQVKGIDPTGVYGLTWTFEAQGGRPRYAAFFANPLELASSMLITLAAAIIYLISVRHTNNKYKYFLFGIFAVVTLLFAYSRASFVACFIMLIFSALLLRYYSVIKAGLFVGIIGALYFFIFASQDFYYFVVDTLTFENSSSVTHVIDWLRAVDSMVANPLGIGLAMSGNAGGVEKELIVGGENQYLIYGVQMGFLGMILYLGMLVVGIRHSWKAFCMSQNRQQAIVPFVAASVKFGLLLPLFTANGEAYLYVSLVSWWMVGSAETTYQDIRLSTKRELPSRL